MAEYIEREAAMDVVRQTYGNYSAAFPKLRKLPASDVAQVRHGRWQKARYTEAPLHICSKCDKPEYKQHNYCPNCGAKMDA